MGLLRIVTRFLRTGVWTRSLVKYSSVETLAPSYQMVNEEAFVGEGFRGNALVYRCVQLLANSASQPEMVGVRETPEGDADLPPADPLVSLLERPSTEHGSQTGFIADVVTYLMLLGEAPLYKVPGEKTGRTVELQLIRPSKIEVEKDSRGNKVYLYRYDPSKNPKRLTPDQIIFLKLRDPLNRARGLAPLAAAARETDTDNEVTDWRKAFFQDGAIPPGILTTEQPASQKQLEEWAVMWTAKYGGKKGAGKTPALAGGLSYQATGVKPGDFTLDEFSGLSESRICMAFGVPPVLVGAKVGLDRSTYANYQHARRSFWEETVSPLLTFLSDELTDGLTANGDGRLVKFDTSKVAALQEDRDKVETRYGNALKNGAITVNEYREKLGLDPVPDGDVYYQPGSVKVIHAGDLGVEEEPEPEVDPEEDPEEQEEPALEEETV